MTPEVTNFRPEKWLVQYEDIVEGNALRYFKSKNIAPSLQHLASIHAVASLWYEHFAKSKQFLNTSHLGGLLLDVANHLKELRIPETAKKKLQPYIVLVGEQTYEWIVLYDEKAFKKKKNVNSVAKNYLHKIVWTHHGIIDHIKTAKSMLTVDPILLQRASLICDLCKDAVLISPPLAFVEDDEDDHPENSGYFSFRLIKDLSVLEKKPPSSDCMFCFEREISEYLKTPLNFELENDSTICNCLLRVDFFCALLSKCCGPFLEELFIRTESGLMGFLFQLLSHPQWIDYCLPTLYRFRNDMNVKKLSTILKRLKLIIQSSFCWAVRGFSCMFDKCVFIFEELWSFVPEQLRMNILEAHPEVFSWLWSCNCLHNLRRYFYAYDGTSARAKLLMLTSSCYRVAFSRTISIEWNCFERYCIPIFFSNCDSKLRNEFISTVTMDVMLDCARLENWQNLEEFLKWSYKSPAVRQTNTRRLLCEIFPLACINFAVPKKRYNTRATSTQQIMELDFTLYDKLLMYYFRTERAASVFKTGELIRSCALAEALFSCTMERRYDLVDVCLKWLFSENASKIKKFKYDYRNGWLKRDDDGLHRPSKKRKIE